MKKNNTNDKIALIESEYFEYLTEENGEKVWKKLEIENLPFIPIIVKTHIRKYQNQKLYIIEYKLPYSNEYITPKYHDFFIEDALMTLQFKTENKEYEKSECTIRLNNQEIDIPNRVNKRTSNVLEYLSKKKRQVYTLNKLIMKKGKTKIKKAP